METTTPSTVLSTLAPTLEVVFPDEIARATTMMRDLSMIIAKITGAKPDSKAFQVHVGNVFGKLDKRLKHVQDADMKKIEAAMAKHGIFDACFHQLLQIISKSSPEIYETLKEIRSTHARLFAEMHAASVAMLKNSETRAKVEAESATSSFEAAFQNSQKEIAQLKLTTISLDTEAEDQNKMILLLQKQLKDAHEKIQELSGGRGTPGYNQTRDVEDDENGSTVSLVNSLRATALGDDSMSVSQQSTTPSKRSGNKKLSLVNGGKTYVGDATWVLTFRQAVQRSIDEGKSRTMVLNECKELISRIYDAKATISSATSAAATTKSLVPIPETLEIFVYRFFEKKYGLRNLAVEAAGTLVSSMEKFYQDDNGIAVFRKIFKNEIGEEFLVVQAELSKSISDLLTVQLMGKYPTKSPSDIKEEYNKKIAVGLVEQEWTDIIKYLYNEDDSDALCRILKGINTGTSSADNSSSSSKTPETNDIMSPNSAALKRYGYMKPSPSPSSTRTSKKDITMISFELLRKVVLDFQLNSHVEYLHEFQISFAHNDGDNDGIVTSPEIEQIFRDVRAKLVFNAESFRLAKASLKTQEQKQGRRAFSPCVSLKSPPASSPTPNLGGTLIGFPTSPVRQISPEKVRKLPSSRVPLETKYQFNAFEKDLLKTVQEAADPNRCNHVTYSNLVLAFGISTSDGGEREGHQGEVRVSLNETYER